MTMESQSTHEVEYNGHRFGVALYDSKGDTVIANIQGTRQTVKIIWDPARFPEGPVYLVGSYAKAKRDAIKKYALGILRKIPDMVVSANHGGRSHEIKDQIYISRLIMKGHYRRPSERNIKGVKFIVAGTVVNSSKLEPHIREALWEKVRIETKVSKAKGRVVSYEEAVRLDNN